MRANHNAFAHTPVLASVFLPHPPRAPRSPDFLLNRHKLALGSRQNGRPVGDVELPAWAGGSPDRFLAAQRAAMEAPFVSANLHHWIDLIFGWVGHKGVYAAGGGGATGGLGCSYALAGGWGLRCIQAGGWGTLWRLGKGLTGGRGRHR